jgi:23S rRNA G2069 N7-methylase RlmK/C1962 C5-methylase RlmI
VTETPKATALLGENSQSLDSLGNRLRKNQKRLVAVARDTDAYRIYDQDIPEWPLVVDLYGDEAVIYSKFRYEEPDFAAVAAIVKDALKLSAVHLKVRKKREREEQYQKLAASGAKKLVHEGPAQFYVNLTDYLDTGLFIDHRPLRQRLAAAQTINTFLNLFSYTGTVSVAAALGGAFTTSVDRSHTYLDWSRENFTANKLVSDKHRFIREDSLTFLRESSDSFDCIFLDPPSFSNSKSLPTTFDVQRDHEAAIKLAMARLKPLGLLIFSTNLRRFKMAEGFDKKFAIENVTADTIPADCRDQKIHQVYFIRHASKGRG